MTVRVLAQIMAERLGVPHLAPAFGPARTGDVRHSLADISRAKQLLGYEPVADLETGLGETLDWCKRAFAESEAR